MAKQKLTKTEREECEKNLATCRQLTATFETMLKDDDEAEKSVAAHSESAAVRKVADTGVGGTREQVQRGVLAIRTLGGRRGGPQS
jgi:hypothetical protein